MLGGDEPRLQSLGRDALLLRRDDAFVIVAVVALLGAADSFDRPAAPSAVTGGGCSETQAPMSPRSRAGNRSAERPTERPCLATVATVTTDRAPSVEACSGKCAPAMQTTLATSCMPISSSASTRPRTSLWPHEPASVRVLRKPNSALQQSLRAMQVGSVRKVTLGYNQVIELVKVPDGRWTTQRTFRRHDECARPPTRGRARAPILWREASKHERA